MNLTALGAASESFNPLECHQIPIYSHCCITVCLFTNKDRGEKRGRQVKLNMLKAARSVLIFYSRMFLRMAIKSHRRGRVYLNVY